MFEKLKRYWKRIKWEWDRMGVYCAVRMFSIPYGIYYWSNGLPDPYTPYEKGYDAYDSEYERCMNIISEWNRKREIQIRIRMLKGELARNNTCPKRGSIRSKCHYKAKDKYKNGAWNFTRFKFRNKCRISPAIVRP